MLHRAKIIGLVTISALWLGLGCGGPSKECAVDTDCFPVSGCDCGCFSSYTDDLLGMSQSCPCAAPSSCVCSAETKLCEHGN